MAVSTEAGSSPRHAEAVATDFIHFFNHDANHHFREEEEVLLPAFARFGDPTEPAVVRVLVEHVQLRRLVSDLERQLATHGPSEQTMHELGALLQEHIRHEENVLFPLIERAMPEEALVLLAVQLVARGMPQAEGEG